MDSADKKVCQDQRQGELLVLERELVQLVMMFRKGEDRGIV